MNKNDIVQIDSHKTLDKSLHGCIGFVKESNANITKINIYYPAETGKNAYSKTYEVPTGNVTYIGEPKLKPL